MNGADVSKPQNFIDLLDAWFGGGITTLIGAALGQYMHHVNEVRAERRRVFGWEIVWELPISVGMAVMGESLSSYLGFDHTVGVGVIAFLAYLGPKLFEVLIIKYLMAKFKQP